jgi:hypothetical protein
MEFEPIRKILALAALLGLAIVALALLLPLCVHSVQKYLKRKRTVALPTTAIQSASKNPLDFLA